MKVIAVDDEILQLETIEEYVAEIYPEAQISSFTKVSDALKYAETETADIAILDISMPGNINGINLGEILRQKNKRIKLLYCTGFSDYAIEAFKIHANGYLRKPIQKEELGREIQYVMQMPVFGDEQKPYIHTFGNFDVFADSRPVAFKRKKSKEILAYLTDRQGSWVTNRELVVVLWESFGSDNALSKYITTLVNDMLSDLERAGIAHIVERQRGKLRLMTDEVRCDYYEYLDNKTAVNNKVELEYMSQYSWGEKTLALILGNDMP